MPDKPTVILADDHRIVVDGLRGLLEQADFILAGIAATGVELVDLAQKVKPDVIVADISMPQLNGIDAVRKLREDGIESKVVFLTMHHDADYVRSALDAGANGYVVKLRLASDLEPALWAAARGERFISPVPELRID